MSIKEMYHINRTKIPGSLEKIPKIARKCPTSPVGLQCAAPELLQLQLDVHQLRGVRGPSQGANRRWGLWPSAKQRRSVVNSGKYIENHRKFIEICGK